MKGLNSSWVHILALYLLPTGPWTQPVCTCSLTSNPGGTAAGSIYLVGSIVMHMNRVLSMVFGTKMPG